MNNELIERIEEEIGDWAKVVVPPAHIRLLQDCKAALMCAGADNESLAEQNRKLSDLLTQQQEAEPVDDGAMFDWIDARARETFSRHKSVARGQQITAADNPESHLIWAALKWAEAHPPKPAAQPIVTDDMRMAVRWAASSAYWSQVLIDIFGPDARDGIYALEAQLREAQAAQPQVPEVPHIWVLTESYNDYNQHGGYFVAAWTNKPTLQQIAKVCGITLDGAEHVLDGGGRQGLEEQWYELMEYEQLSAAKEESWA